MNNNKHFKHLETFFLPTSCKKLKGSFQINLHIFVEFKSRDFLTWYNLYKNLYNMSKDDVFFTKFWCELRWNDPRFFLLKGTKIRFLLFKRMYFLLFAGIRQG